MEKYIPLQPSRLFLLLSFIYNFFGGLSLPLISPCNNSWIIDSQNFIRIIEIIGMAQARLSTNGYLSPFRFFFSSFSSDSILYSLGKPYRYPTSFRGRRPRGWRVPRYCCSVYLNDLGSFIRRPPSRFYLQKPRTPFRVAWHWAIRTRIRP